MTLHLMILEKITGARPLQSGKIKKNETGKGVVVGD